MDDGSPVVKPDLAGKVVLVTGASKGIGAAIAGAVARAGGDVIAHYGADRAGASAALGEAPPERCHLVGADLSVRGGADELWRRALAWRGHVDVVVNNAAVMLWDGGMDADDQAWDEAWSTTLQVNVLSPARVLRGAVRHFRERGGGIIITMSSWSAQRGSSHPDTLAYAASKAAIKAATQTIARGYAMDGILAYIVAPGVVRTKMSEDFAASQGGEVNVTAGLAMGEWVPPEDLGQLVVFLATGRARHLTGATLDVNGASYPR